MYPDISVLMPAFNAGNYLSIVVNSILNQTFANFEFIIVDDGSTDRTRIRLEQYAEKDNRIRVLSKDINRGITASLNYALEHARGRFIARIDVDDISRPRRLERQIAEFLDDDKLVLCGTNAIRVSNKLIPLYPTFLPTNDWDIRCLFPFENPFIHSSVMMRTDSLREIGGYDEKFNVTQDYELWMRLLKKGRVKNISDPLVLLRLHEESITAKSRTTQIELARLVQTEYTKMFVPEIVPADCMFENVTRKHDSVYAQNTCACYPQLAVKNALVLLSSIKQRYSDSNILNIRFYVMFKSLRLMKTQILTREFWTMMYFIFRQEGLALFGFVPWIVLTLVRGLFQIVRYGGVGLLYKIRLRGDVSL